MREIRKIVCDVFNLTETEWLSKKRNREFVDARMCYINILAKHFNYGSSQLGRDMKKDHATIIHSIKMHDNLFPVTQPYSTLYKEAESLALDYRVNTIDVSRKFLIKKNIENLQKSLEQQQNLLYEITKRENRILSK